MLRFNWAQKFVQLINVKMSTIVVIYNRLFCCNHTFYLVGMVSVTLASHYVTSVSHIILDEHQRSDSTEFHRIGRGSSDCCQVLNQMLKTSDFSPPSWSGKCQCIKCLISIILLDQKLLQTGKAQMKSPSCSISLGSALFANTNLIISERNTILSGKYSLWPLIVYNGPSWLYWMLLYGKFYWSLKC